MDKRTAVTEQIDQAIRLLREGWPASAITLAAAAEGAMPAPEHDTLFAWLREIGVTTLNISEKEMVSKHLNRTRDWLKHDGPADTLDINDIEALFMLFRAYSKFIQVYGEAAQSETMRSFTNEIVDSIRKLLAPFLELIRQLSGQPSPEGETLPA